MWSSPHFLDIELEGDTRPSDVVAFWTHRQLTYSTLNLNSPSLINRHAVG
jgi:hypothetical protein